MPCFSCSFPWKHTHTTRKKKACLHAAVAAAKLLQLCTTLCDPIDGSPPGSPVPGILQARTLEWVDISFSNAGKGKVKVKSLSHVWLLVTPWTAAHQAPPSMGFSRQEYWVGRHCLLYVLLLLMPISKGWTILRKFKQILIQLSFNEEFPLLEYTV